MVTMESWSFREGAMHFVEGEFEMVISEECALFGKSMMTENDVSLEEKYRELGQPHIDSFDHFLDEGLQQIVNRVQSLEVEHPLTKRRYEISISNPSLGRPSHTAALNGGLLYPRECREMRLSYTALLCVDVMIGRVWVNHSLGQIPIMVKSRACNLRGMSREEMQRRGEEGNDFGGYFVAGGLDKVIRMLFAEKRHYIMAKDRAFYMRQGNLYTSKATTIRCVRDDELGRSVTCHYLSDGTVMVGFVVGSISFFLHSCIILRALHECNDRELFEHLVSGNPDHAQSAHGVFVTQHAELCIRKLSSLGLKTQAECIEYLGRHFRSPMKSSIHKSDHETGLEFLRDYIFCHLDCLKKKFLLLIQMMQKLFAFANSVCCEDGPDSLGCLEMLPSGYIYMKVVGDLMQQFVSSVKYYLEKALEKSPETTDLEDVEAVTKIVNRSTDVGKRLLHFIKTGRFTSSSSRDIGQLNGICIIAERINFLRYLSHFRAAHRGQVYTQMRTTQPRKLLPDSWGFICPVHTPDGPLCGLLLHLTAVCKIATPSISHRQVTTLSIKKVLTGKGMIPTSAELHPPFAASGCLPVILDGDVIGYIATELIPSLMSRLHLIKALNRKKLKNPHDGDLQEAYGMDVYEMGIPFDTEVAYYSYEAGGPFPGVLISTQIGRFLRPVLQISSQLEEWIGPQEQLTLSIRCPDGLIHPYQETYTHEEIHSNHFLSILAALTPFSDFNQSPRNMYQCQMAKQTMGTPCHDIQFRPDVKLYTLQTPQKPICRTRKYQELDFNQYPSGTNAVVAVLAFTGYDMEDAMILNKASVDRGFAHGCIYKTERIFLSDNKSTDGHTFASDLSSSAAKKQKMKSGVEDSLVPKFPANLPVHCESEAVRKLHVVPTGDYNGADRLDVDGLPHVGTVVKSHESYCSTMDPATGGFRTLKLKGDETAVVDKVGVIGSGHRTGLKNVNIKLRLNRNPIIGDKFASRAGQKGILSQKWPDEDFPFSSMTGMRPDLIINPHAFPSRMTIGMLIESLTSKAGALEGKFVDCSPFQQCDYPNRHDSVTEFGKCLEKAGFHHQGMETMISGITGEEMPCEIYIGLVYYQRLRHMVSDKYQCRATGPVNSLTRQPVQGRKFGGGIRVGEMERDSILAHGTAFLMTDRLSISSDRCISVACGRCGSLNGPHAQKTVLPDIDARLFRRLGTTGTSASHIVCPFCGNASDAVMRYSIPRVINLLASELAAINIRLIALPDAKYLANH